MMQHTARNIDIRLPHVDTPEKQKEAKERFAAAYVAHARTSEVAASIAAAEAVGYSPASAREAAQRLLGDHTVSQRIVTLSKQYADMQAPIMLRVLASVALDDAAKSGDRIRAANGILAASSLGQSSDSEAAGVASSIKDIINTIVESRSQRHDDTMGAKIIDNDE